MDILYLHDLNSKLSDKNRLVLEKHGNVFAPDIDYSNEKTFSSKTISKYLNPNKHVIIGYGMGAVNGFISSNLIGTPALLFNPPLMKYLKDSKVPQIVHGSKYFVLGAKDEVVDPRETLTFLKDHLHQQRELEIKVYPNLGHEISSKTFCFSLLQYSGRTKIPVENSFLLLSIVILHLIGVVPRLLVRVF